jgi:DNA primase catalytic core
MSGEVQDIYSILLSRGHARTLFAELRDQRQEGREVRAVCPLCSDGGHHFSYNLDKPLWICHASGEGGDWLRYMERRAGMDFKDALLYLAEQAGVKLQGVDRGAYDSYTRKADLLEAIQQRFRTALTSPEGEPVLHYLQDRGYSREESVEMELGAYLVEDSLRSQLQKDGYTREELEATGLFTSSPWQKLPAWLTVLWRDQAGRPLGFVARPPLSCSEQELKDRGLRKYHYAYGLEKSKGFSGLSFTQASRSGSIMLVEGLLDALYLNVKGAEPPAVSIGGTTLSEAQRAALERVGTKEVLLALDQDGPGQEATLRLIQKLRETDLHPLVVSWPEAYKDPDELVRAEGLEMLQKASQTAVAWPKWLAGYLVHKQVTDTDRGLELALAETAKAYGGLSDPLEQRQFREALSEATGLPLSELEPRLARQAEKASEEKARMVLSEMVREVQAKASEGDIIGAERLLGSSLEKLRRSRGVVVPEPYLVADLEQDILLAKAGLRTGYEALDRLLSIPQGAITIVAGRPKHGKTTLQLNLLARMLKNYPEMAFAFFSYEESRRALALKLIMMEAGEVLDGPKNYDHYVRYFKEERPTRPAIEQAISLYESWTSSGRLLLSDQRLSAEDLSATIGHLSGRGPLGAVFVDYIQKVPLQGASSGQRYEYIQQVSGLLLDTAIQTDLPIILGAQLGRDKDSKDKVRLDNIRESGDIEQDANLVLGLLNKTRQKEEDDGVRDSSRSVELDIRVLKNRAGQDETTVGLMLDRPILRILDKDTDHRVAAFR